MINYLSEPRVKRGAEKLNQTDMGSNALAAVDRTFKNLITII